MKRNVSYHVNNSKSLIESSRPNLLCHRLKAHIKSFNTVCQCTKGYEVDPSLCVWNHRIEGDTTT